MSPNGNVSPGLAVCVMVGATPELSVAVTVVHVTATGRFAALLVYCVITPVGMLVKTGGSVSGN